MMRNAVAKARQLVKYMHEVNKLLTVLFINDQSDHEEDVKTELYPPSSTCNVDAITEKYIKSGRLKKGH